MLRGVITMPSNIFATTSTNVSILFIDKTNKEKVVLIDASKLGKKVKEGKNQKILLSENDETQIIDIFNYKKVVDDFSIVVGYSDIQAKNYSLSASQYFDIKIEYTDITQEDFSKKMSIFKNNLQSLSSEADELKSLIFKNLKSLNYD